MCFVILLQNELKLGIFTSQSCSHGNEMCKEKYEVGLLKLLFCFTFSVPSPSSYSKVAISTLYTASSFRKTCPIWLFSLNQMNCENSKIYWSTFQLFLSYPLFWRIWDLNQTKSQNSEKAAKAHFNPRLFIVPCFSVRSSRSSAVAIFLASPSPKPSPAT